MVSINWGTTAIGHKACFLVPIELACKHNEVWDTGVILPKFLSWFETLEGLVFIDAL